MAQEQDGRGTDEPAAEDTIAGTGRGIPDDALTPGETLPTPPSDAEVERVARAMGAPSGEKDTLPLEGE